MNSFKSRKSQPGATQLGFLDVVTAIVVLAILVYAASRQFPTYGSGLAPISEQSQSQAH